mgnify:CR=1 FL=1
MGLPIPRSKLEWALYGSCTLLVGAVAFYAALSSRDGVEVSSTVGEVNEVERQSYLDAKRQYEKMKVRQKERCDEKIAICNKEKENLQERVDVCPCCPGGCEEELVYKDWIFQSQATYYKKILKKHCGVRHPPDPGEKELEKMYSGELSEEELEELE